MNWELFLSEQLKDKEFNYVRLTKYKSNPHVVTSCCRLLCLLLWEIGWHYDNEQSSLATAAWLYFFLMLFISLSLYSNVKLNLSVSLMRASLSWLMAGSLCWFVLCWFMLENLSFPVLSIENWEIWYSPVRTNKTWYGIISRQSPTDFYNSLISPLSSLENWDRRRTNREEFIKLLFAQTWDIW